MCIRDRPEGVRGAVWQVLEAWCEEFWHHGEEVHGDAVTLVLSLFHIHIVLSLFHIHIYSMTVS